MSKSDLELKQEVEQELLWDPKVKAAQIGVSVIEGVVTLSGAVDTYWEKWVAEDAVKRVGGVRSVTQNLTVQILRDHESSDSDLTAAIEHALAWDILIPKTVTAKVAGGAVTLSGLVTWNFQRESAERAIRRLKGVVAVNNDIKLAPQVSPAEVKQKIQSALDRQAVVDGKSIVVDTSGGTVTLTGHASSWQSIEDAAHAAWGAAGVTKVLDQVKREMTF